MAIVATGLTSGAVGGSGSTSAQTVTISPTVGRVYLLLALTKGTAANAGTTTATGCGLTWSEEGHQDGATGNTNTRLTVLTGVGTPSSGKVTISWVASGYAAWSIVEFNGVSGIRQLTTAAEVSHIPSPHTPTLTLAAFASASNGTYGGFMSGDTITSITPGSGFTKIHDASSPVGFRIYAEYRPDNDTTVDISQAFGGDVNYIIAGLELVAGVAGTQTIIPDGISSAESVGTPKVNVSVAPSSIASGEALGTVAVSVGGLTVRPTGIASLEAIGTPTVTGGEVSIAPSSIGTLEAFGTLQVNLRITPDSIATAQAFGTLSVSQVLIGALVTSEETLTALVEGFDSRQD